MAIVPYSSQDEYDLVNDEQDCRGKVVVDGEGNRIGVVKEMMVDTESDLVSHFFLEDGTEIPARQVSLADRARLQRQATSDAHDNRNCRNARRPPGYDRCLGGVSGGRHT